MANIDPTIRKSDVGDHSDETTRNNRWNQIGLSALLIGTVAVVGLKLAYDSQPKPTVLPHVIAVDKEVIYCSQFDNYAPKDHTDRNIVAGERPIFPFSKLPAKPGTDAVIDIVSAEQNHMKALEAAACDEYGRSHGGIRPHHGYEVATQVETVPTENPTGFRFLVSVVGEA